VGVEIHPLDLLRIGQEDAADAQRGELGPEPLHDLRSRQGEQEVDRRPRRHGTVEDATKDDRLRSGRFDLTRPRRPVHEPDPHAHARRGAKHGPQMPRPPVAQLHAPLRPHFRLPSPSSPH